MPDTATEPPNAIPLGGTWLTFLANGIRPTPPAPPPIPLPAPPPDIDVLPATPQRHLPWADDPLPSIDYITPDLSGMPAEPTRVGPDTVPDSVPAPGPDDGLRPLTPQERADIMRGQGFEQRQIDLAESVYRAADVGMRQEIDGAMRDARDGGFMARQPPTDAVPAGHADPTRPNAGDTIPDGPRPGTPDATPTDPTPHGDATPGRGGSLAKVGVVLDIVGVFDGLWRDGAELITGRPNEGFLQPAIHGTPVESLVNGMAAASPITTGAIQRIENNLGHTAGAVAGVVAAPLQVGEMVWNGGVVIGNRLESSLGLGDALVDLFGLGGPPPFEPRLVGGPHLALVPLQAFDAHAVLIA